jgi:hypothetical protein
MNKVSILTLTTVWALFLGFALSPGGALAQQQSLREQLVGTWQLVSNDNIAPNGEKRQLFGNNPKGMTIYDADGWYVQLQVNPDRPKFKGKTRLDGTADENAAVVHSTAGQFGRWSVNEADKTLTVRQEVNTFPNDDGLVSTRAITLTGDELKVTNPNPSGGGTAMLVWRRVE